MFPVATPGDHLHSLYFAVNVASFQVNFCHTFAGKSAAIQGAIVSQFNAVDAYAMAWIQGGTILLYTGVSDLK
jgi:hypothetical protein